MSIPYLNEIVSGDARELAKSIPDASIDLIFTDPPYPGQYLPLYEWLGKEAARVLKPGGFLLAYAGVYHKAQVMQSLSLELEYFWDFVSANLGNAPIMWKRKIISRHKSILAFVKGKGLPRCNVVSLWTGGGEDKRYHVWGQDESTARYYIDCFSSSRDVIWDPFCGGGTTLVACKMLGRNFIAFELESDTADIARKRLETVQPLLMHDDMEQLTWSEVAV